MGFSKVDNQWIRIRGGRPQGQEEEEEEDEEQEPAAEGEGPASPMVTPIPSAPVAEPSRRSPARQRIIFDEGAPSSTPPSVPLPGFSRLHPDDITAIAREVARFIPSTVSRESASASASAPAPAPASASDPVFASAPAFVSSAVEPHYSMLAQSLALISEELKTVSFEVHRLTGRHLDLEQRLLSVERAVSSLVSDPADLAAARRQLLSGPTLADISASVAGLKKILNTSAAALGGLSAEMDQKFVILNTSFHSTTLKVESLSRRVDQISTLLSPVSSVPPPPAPPTQPTFIPVHFPPSSTFGPSSRTRKSYSKRKAQASSDQPLDIEDSDSD